AALYQSTQGNPLFVLQLVAGARTSGALRPVGGTWQLESRLPLPDDVTDAINARLAHLDPGDRAILELVALGEPIGATMLEDLAGEGGFERLESLEADGFIAAELSGQRLEVR